MAAENTILLIGKTGSGKTSLIQSFRGEEIAYKKTQAIEFHGEFIDSPGEFLENRRLLPALLTSAARCTMVALVQDASSGNSAFSPGFVRMFNKQVVGIVTKTDKQDSCPERAEKFLSRAGARTIIRTSVVDGTGLDQLQRVFTQGA